MNEQRSVSRRRFILLSALSAAAGAFWSACARFQPASALTPEERRIVEALADQVIPPDADVPGGKDAGVAEFIDRQLRGPYGRHRAAYRAGLAKIDQTSRRVDGRPFVELAFDRQTALLEALEANRVPEGIWDRNEAGRFFRLVADHCLQGFYGSPRHGGNRNLASWKMLGLATPQILGRVVNK